MLRKFVGTCTGALLVAGLLLAPAPTPAQAGPVFVTRNGAAFDLGGQPFRFGGTNNYYMHYKPQAMVDDVLADMVAMNLKVLRTWTFLECGGDRPNSSGGCSQGADLWMQRYSTAAGGPVYNTGPNGLQKLDYLLAEAAERGIKVIMTLTNNWRDFGGMDQYVTWYGGQFHDQFYTDARVKQAYKDWARTLINRTNSITGTVYRNDPSIFSWELANEPRCINSGSLPSSGTCTADTLVSWAGEMSTYIKSLDPNHMVSVGDEGFGPGTGTPNGWPYNVTDGVDHARLTALPNIDFGTYHLYPDHWTQTPAWGTQWILDHQAAAAALNKPTVLEEFGISATGQYASQRATFYQQWVDAVRTGGGDGWMFWILTGIDENGGLYPDYDGYRVVYPSADATLLSNAAVAIGGGGTCNDTVAPSTPTGLSVSGTTLSWNASTDSGCSGLAGYTVYRSTGAVLGTSTGTSLTLTGLTPGTTYTVYVRARDNAGNQSAPSTSVTFTTPSTPVGSCRVAYTISPWGGSNGFTAGLTLSNTGTSTVDGWTLAFALPSGQAVSLPGWSATWSQSGQTVTARPLDWNRVLAPGQSTSIGFNGTHTGNTAEPAAFTLNGASCTVA